MIDTLCEDVNKVDLDRLETVLQELFDVMGGATGVFFNPDNEMCITVNKTENGELFNQEDFWI